MLIAAARLWDTSSWADPARIAGSLGLFANRPCPADNTGDDWFFHQPSPRATRAAPSRWRVARTPSGLPVLFAGWIDNDLEIQSLLGRTSPDLATLYGAAFDAWGDEADNLLIGCFTSAIALPDGTLRLSRGPWSSRPLFYAADRSAAVAATVPRALFAAGWRQSLRPEAIARLLAYRLDDDEATPYEGVRQVPVGAIVRVTRDGAEVNRWYDPRTALTPLPAASDEDYVAEANRLLARTVGAALRLSSAPGATLSGGLDSPIVADEIHRQLPEGRQLRTYTFHPLDDWRGAVPARYFPDDRPYVREFARTHPRIDSREVANDGYDFDSLTRELTLSAGTTVGAGSAISAVMLGCYRAAAQDGCDWLFTATLGNQTISMEPPWLWPELLRSGQWRELWQLAAARPGDRRPILRRIAAHAIMPQLPERLRRRIRTMVHGFDPEAGPVNPLLREGSLAARLGEFPAREGLCSIAGEAPTRAEWITQLHRMSGQFCEHNVAVEEVFGLRLRDITQSRPLIEFCARLPALQFARGGQDRYLARRMAVGRMPEGQRLNRLHGMHNTDWHLRMGRRLPELRARAEGLAAHPLLGPMLDQHKLHALFDQWPEEAPSDPSFGSAWRFDLAGALVVADYVDQVTGRNGG